MFSFFLLFISMDIRKIIREELEMMSDTKINDKVALKDYIEAALWTEEDNIDFEDATMEYIHDDSIIDAWQDVKKFIETAGSLLDGMDSEQVGHDLWLTRNGQGTGFWDRGLGEVGDKLAKIASSMGEKNLFWGEDGKIHIE